MKIFLLLILLLSPVTQAKTFGSKHIEGTVTSMDEKTIKIENDLFTYEVPKKLITPRLVKAGEKVIIPLSDKQLTQIKTKMKPTK